MSDMSAGGQKRPVKGGRARERNGDGCWGKDTASRTRVAQGTYGVGATVDVLDGRRWPGSHVGAEYGTVDDGSGGHRAGEVS